MHRVKGFKVKAVSEDTEGYHFEGWASTYDNTDREGDVMIKGAFKKSVKSKSVVSMFVNHDMNQLPIGTMELSEIDGGLWAKGTFDLEDPEAIKVYRKMKMQAMDSMSIGFFVKNYEPIDNQRPFGGWNIKEAEVYEVSIVNVPANAQALVTSVKGVGMINGNGMKKRQEILDILD